MSQVDYTLVLEVRNQPGVLVRIAHVFARRGCNIRSLHVQPHSSDQWSTMIIIVRNVPHIGQITRQLEKLIDVARVTAHTAQQNQEQLTT
jgi:acetolactate synthase-1/3 small subunit